MKANTPDLNKVQNGFVPERMDLARSHSGFMPTSAKSSRRSAASEEL
jgi:hypothetical protein